MVRDLFWEPAQMIKFPFISHNIKVHVTETSTSSFWITIFMFILLLICLGCSKILESASWWLIKSSYSSTLTRLDWKYLQEVSRPTLSCRSPVTETFFFHRYAKNLIRLNLLWPLERKASHRLMRLLHMTFSNSSF